MAFGLCNVSVAESGSPGSNGSVGGSDVSDSAGSVSGGSGGGDGRSGKGGDQGKPACIDVKPVSPQPPAGDSRWGGANPASHVLYAMECTLGYFLGVPDTLGDPIYVTTFVVTVKGQPPKPPAQPPPDPAVLAQQVVRTLKIPAPSTGRYPAGVMPDGRPYTAVHAYTWFWTDPAGWQPLSASASLRGVSVTVTATPSALEFTPGDGSAAVSCSGPGVAWNAQSFGPWAASPVGCDYVYPHSSAGFPDQEVTATYGIVWHITWTSNTGAHGALPDLTTAARSSFVVAQVQAVVVK
jgi:hypothetical protein